jgi:16S rRNA G966 N2-methylase RsmD
VRGLANVVKTKIVDAGRVQVLNARQRVSSSPDSSHKFFDDYPRFYETSVTGIDKHRLQERYRALIEWNREIIKGSRVLDLASHDGRWSFAAVNAGAESAVGIEAREHLVKAADENVRSYGLAGKFRFIQADVFAHLDFLAEHPEHKFDVVFCFGFLYHTVHHMLLLNKIAKLKPRHLIVDTKLSLNPEGMIEVRPENVADESSGAVPEAGHVHAVVGIPSGRALELMLFAAGFGNLRYYPWRDVGITDWTELDAYYRGKRVSVVAEGPPAAH